ncbi:transketolase [Desulfonatronospira thiodismutans ASO3-1]|uniref:Transketolase n=1 Tax=Desulfonatronospira thiodismutans ASO3-1 TaxID=555779 RepID=D6STL6_9BACT|nr:transketolase [Desulfonatronospira thiodismutans ASO3-1]
MSTSKDLATAIRVLSMDAVQKAKSGHPGAPMGMADMAVPLWREILAHNPANPKWPDRDRFVLSNGHASMLLYSLLHLTGYDLSINDLRNFRQLHSKTPGHPEYGVTPGVETTTGPLGQGLANAVGMALAESILAARFNRENLDIVNHYTYTFLGDGCLMEGISHEACSLAGTLGLGKLIALYDDNEISIDGQVSGWFTEDIPSRFTAYGWHVISGVDGHDQDEVKNAILEARNETRRPSLICCKTVIGHGAPNLCGSADCHGAPLGDGEIQAARANLGWEHPAFEIPEYIYQAFDCRERGARLEEEWNSKFAEYQAAYPEQAREFLRCIAGDLPGNLDQTVSEMIKNFDQDKQPLATRKASHKIIDVLTAELPEMLGGSADLTGSNKTMRTGARPVSKKNKDGDYIYYGVREFAMGAIMNGLALHGGFIPFGGTFLVFSDYSRNSLRMGAMMGLRCIHVLTHDSIGVGEDGPTHQPIEHTASLRLIPNMSVWRPCDTVETAVAWHSALKRNDGPTCLVLSRHKLKPMQRSTTQLENIRRGGYILLDCEGTPEAIILASGSEVEPALDAAKELGAKGRRIRMVSMPSINFFMSQDINYQKEVLPREVEIRLAVEAGAGASWHQVLGCRGEAYGIERFGESAPGSILFPYFKMTSTDIAQKLLDMLQQ